MPVNRCSSVGVGKYPASPVQSPRYIFLLHLHGSGVTAPPFGCSASSAGCHGSCSSFSFVTAAPVSFAALHSTAPHFRSITPRSQLSICYMAGHPISNTQSHTHMGCTCLSASQPYNTHWVSFRSVRRYFISVLLSPPAAHNLLAGCPHFGCVR